MAYEQFKTVSNVLDQELGYEYVEVEFLLEEVKVQKQEEEKEKSKVYVLSPKLSRKELRKDRRSRQKKYLKDREPSVYEVAEYRLRLAH